MAAQTLIEKFLPKSPDLVTITGVSGSGKTAMLLDIAAERRTEDPIPFVSFAHSKGAIIQRLRRRPTEKEPNIALYDDSSIDIGSLEDIAKPNTPLFIDGFNFLEDFERERGRNEEVTALCRRLKRLARKINAPVVQTAMLSDYGKTRSQRWFPFWGASIKESSYIRDFSDSTIYLHREALFLEFDRPADHDLDALNQWQTDMEACYCDGQAYTWSHGAWKTHYLQYFEQDGWSVPATKHQ